MRQKRNVREAESNRHIINQPTTVIIVAVLAYHHNRQGALVELRGA